MRSRRVVFMIDGWFMRKVIYTLKTFSYNGLEIRKYCLRHLKEGDYLYRIFYYDTEPLKQKASLPITKADIDFSQTKVAQEQTKLLDSIRHTPNFALRLGKTVWQNGEWVLTAARMNDLLQAKISVTDLQDRDFRPLIRQKGVDMRLGLDITYIATRSVADLMIVITGDADIVPALKFARREGMQVCLDSLGRFVRPELREHIDFCETFVSEKKRKEQPKLLKDL